MELSNYKEAYHSNNDRRKYTVRELLTHGDDLAIPHYLTSS